mmetsp:Transcript_25396/g.65629  ORF Transcript_25396/g.65629 Transcript_25396/m.65629 type:complete len:224 (+) Transcript_25396:189-860(+)
MVRLPEPGRRAVLVEPQPAIAAKLRKFVEPYKSRVNVVEAAACPKDSAEPLTFYALSNTINPKTGRIGNTHKHLPFWASQVASFDRSHIERANAWTMAMAGVNLTDYIEEVKVPCYSLETLARMNHIGPGADDLALLSVDAEGLDLSILMAANLGSIQPAVLVFEVKHRQSVSGKCDVYKKLAQAGYECACAHTENAECLRQDVARMFSCMLPGYGCLAPCDW